MIKDSEISLILTQTEFQELFTGSQVKPLIVDQNNFYNELIEQAHDNPVIELLKPQSLAYMIYTSGSTGQPKGVLNTHLGLNNLSHWHIKKFKVNADKVGSHLTSIGFDAALWEVWPYLMTGGKVQLIPNHIRVSPKELVQYLNKYHVTHSFLPTALLESSYEDFNSPNNNTLEYIFAGGEKLNKHGFTQCQTRLINIYGPTESSVVTTFYDVEHKSESKAPPLGKPVDNFRLYILNDYRSLVPYQSTGELYIAGDGLALGYQNNDQLSANKFIKHTFSDGHTEHLYQTGDLVRYIDKGILDFVARVDNQVKIRGFRIEPEEIEFQLSELVEINNAVVLIETDRYENKYLSAYIILNHKFKDQPDISNVIKSELKSFLPSYMIPKYFTFLDDFPLTPNGKVNNRKLTAMIKSIETVSYIPAKSNLEKALVGVLSNELELSRDDISLGSNFFDIGGHSLSLLNVINQLSQCGFDLQLKLFYECENLKEICNQHGLSNSTVMADSLIKLNNNKGTSSLYLFHPMGGRVDCYKKLATNLKSLTPVIGVQAPFITNHDFDFDDFNTLTELYTQAILTHQPNGPYRLGGWSLGGLLAQKVVEKLNNLGKEVEYFVGIDCFMDMPFLQKNDRIKALYETVAFVLNKNISETKQMLKEVKGEGFKIQLTFATKLIIQTEANNVSRDFLIRGLKFGVDLFNAKISKTKQIISKKASLFIAEKNEDKTLLLKGWYDALQVKTLVKEIEGEHLDVLEGESLSQITEQIFSDIKNLNQK